MARHGRFVLVAALLLCASAASAQDFGGAQKEIDSRLERSLGELSDVRARIAKEKVPLSRGVAQLEDQVLTLRRERNRLPATAEPSTSPRCARSRTCSPPSPRRSLRPRSPRGSGARGRPDSRRARV